VAETETFYSDTGWHYLVGVFDNGVQRLYKDGVLVDTANSDGAHPYDFTGRPVNIGFNSTGFYDGKIDDIKIYNYARTQAQIAWDFNRGKPVAHWRMDEATSGAANGQTIYDDSVHDNDGTANYGANLTGMTWTTGKFSGALDFDGVDDLVSIGNTLPTLTEGALEMWFNRDTSLSGYQMLFTDGGSQLEMCYSTNSLVFYVNNVGVNTASANNNGTWQHVVGVFSETGNYQKMYLNGVEVASSTYPGDATAATRYLGSRNSLYPFDGKIDDVRIYNYARTADQIMQDYNQGLAAKLGE